MPPPRSPNDDHHLTPAQKAQRKAKIRKLATTVDSEFERNGYCTEQRAAELLQIGVRTVQKQTRWVKDHWPLHAADLPPCYQTHQAPLPPPLGDAADDPRNISR